MFINYCLKAMMSIIKQYLYDIYYIVYYKLIFIYNITKETTNFNRQKTNFYLKILILMVQKI